MRILYHAYRTMSTRFVLFAYFFSLHFRFYMVYLY
nr:MAG TPA: hypothetical protein [Caudoviricetes sp.]